MIVRSTLRNGVRVVVEQVPGVRSVACGVWVDVGSRDEYAGTFGVSHFLEHLLFKGTQRWSALEIAQRLDAVGGEFNAYTSKEQTVYYVRVLDEDLPLGLDILSDITQRPALRPDEIDSERNVVLEEVNMYEDSPDELVHDLFGEVVLPRHPLGWPVIGTRASIEGLGRDAIAEYFAARYGPERFVIAAAGNIDPDAFLEDAEKGWGNFAAPRASPREQVPLPGAEPFRIDRRDTEQAHIVLGVRTFARDDARRHALAILNHSFGGGMSSRLFQEVREKRGLVYSVYSYRQLFQEVGYVACYAGTAPQRAQETLDVLVGEWDRLADGVTEAEFTAAKSHLKGALALSQEDTGSRMSRIGKAEATLGEVPSIDEVVARLEAVTLDDVNAVAADLATASRTLAVIGPVPDSLAEAAGAGTA